MTKVSVNAVSYREIEKLINEHYGRGGKHAFNVVADQEWGNYEEHEVSVGKEELDEYDAEQLTKFKAGNNPKYVLETLLQDLCNEGKLEPGDYLIKIYW